MVSPPVRVSGTATPRAPVTANRRANRTSECRALERLRGRLSDRRFNYAGDDEKGHLGYLFTSWLTPGLHRFTARVKTTGGEGDCDESGPFGTYRWMVANNQLTLTAIHEPCGQRRAVYEGTWTRAA
jgi:hypothetical protein